MTLVSVIMAAHNAERYIRESIESILDQTWINWELIICDDFSTDSTYEIMKEYAANDSRIVILRNEENKKAAYSRNRCIEVAKGDFIAIQDADDISLRNRLNEEMLFLKDNPSIGFVGSARKSFDESGIFSEMKMKKLPTKEDFLKSFPFVHASIMFRKPVIKDVGGYRVAKETTRGQDADMIMRMYAKGYIGANLEEPLYLYREGRAAESRRTIKKRIMATKIRYMRFKEMGLLPKGLIYVPLPLISAFVPSRLKGALKKRG